MKATLTFYRVDPNTMNEEPIRELGCYFDTKTLTTSAKEFMYQLGLLRMEWKYDVVKPVIHVTISGQKKQFIINTLEDYTVRVHWKEVVSK